MIVHFVDLKEDSMATSSVLSVNLMRAVESLHILLPI